MSKDEKTEDRKEPLLELDMPDGVESADEAVEVLRAWIADGTLLVSLNADAFGEQMHSWGRLLSEIAEHVAKAAALQGYMSEGEAEAAVRQAFNAVAVIQPSNPRKRVSEGKIRRTKH